MLETVNLNAPVTAHFQATTIACVQSSGGECYLDTDKYEEVPADPEPCPTSFVNL